MSEPIPKGWGRWHVGDLIEHHFSGPSPTCEERNIQSADEWGVLKTTAVVWEGWNEEAHKVLPRSYWGQSGLEVHAGDVLVTKAGPRHRVGVVVHVPSTRRRLIVSGKLIGLRVKNGICYPDVLAGVLALKKPQKYLDDRTTGMAESQVNFANKALLQTPVTLPPPREQQVISKIKGALDAQIRQTEVLLAKLKRIKQGLLTDLLTRGIDEDGQLRPTPDQAPHLYKDSPLGRIPREWELACVGDVGDVVTGSTPPSSDSTAWGDALPFFTPSDVIDYEPIQAAERTLSESGREYIREIPAGSTLVVCIGSIGKVGYTACSGATNQQINAVVPVSSWDNYFVFQAIHSYVDQISAWAGLQVIPIVNKSTFSKMLIPQPGPEEQKEISQKIRALDSRIADERGALYKVSNEKSGLMEDLLTGQVRVTPLTEAKQRATT